MENTTELQEPSGRFAKGELLIAIPPTLTLLITMTYYTSGFMQRGLMTIPARRTAVIHPTPAFICNSGMSAIVCGRPVIHCVASNTIQTKHPGVEDRVGMTTHTGC